MALADLLARRKAAAPTVTPVTHGAPPEVTGKVLSDQCGHLGHTGHLERSSEAIEWLAFFDERAAIAEFDGGLSRQDAESLAYDRCVAEWLSRQGDRDGRVRGKAEAADALAAMGIENGSK